MLAAFHDTAPPSGSGSVGAYSSSTSSSQPHDHGPGTQISFQTGDALGKALASVGCVSPHSLDFYVHW